MITWRHCNNCSHEFYGKENAECDWCGSSSYTLETPKTISLREVAEKIFVD